MIELLRKWLSGVNKVSGRWHPSPRGTASSPNVSHAAAPRCLDKEHLAYWERAKNIAIHKPNPQIEIPPSQP